MSPTADGGWQLRKDRRVLGFVAATTVSDIGDQVWLVALSFTAAQMLAPATAGLVIGVATVPRAVMMLFGGVIADRFDTRRIMVSTDLGRVVVLLLGVAGLAVVSVPVVLVAVGVLFGLLEAIHDPAATTFPRQLVADAHLTRVAALRQLGMRMAVTVGAALGGLVLAAFTLRGSMLVDAATFAVLAVVMWLVRPRRALERSENAGVLDSLRSVAAYLRRDRDVRILLLQLSGLNLFLIPVTSLGLALRSTEQGWGAARLGVLLATIGAGAAVGTGLTLVWQPRRPLATSQRLLLLQGISSVVIGVAPFWGVALGTTTIGVTAGIVSPVLSGLFQTTVDESHLGRVSALQRLADDGLMPLTLAGFGGLTGLIGIAGACLIAGIGSTGVVLAGMAMAATSPMTDSARPRSRQASRRRGGTGSLGQVSVQGWQQSGGRDVLVCTQGWELHGDKDADDRFARPAVLVAAFGGGAVVTFVVWAFRWGDPAMALMMAVVIGLAMVAGVVIADRLMAGRTRRKRRDIQDFTGPPGDHR